MDHSVYLLLMENKLYHFPHLGFAHFQVEDDIMASPV